MPKSPEQNSAAANLPEKGQAGALREKILTSLENTGLKEPLSEEVIGRLVLLEQKSEFNEDARQIERGVTNVLNLFLARYAGRYPELRLTAERKNFGRTAAILHDIGKSGPAEATSREQEAVVKLFAIEGINKPERSVGEIVAENFSEGEAEDLLRALAACSIDAKMTMTRFWNHHANWTHDILEKYPAGLNKHIRLIAGSHHIDNEIDPYGTPGRGALKTAEIIKTQGDEIDDLEERVLIVVDRYQAAIRRSRLNHREAINWLRKNLAKYKKDDLLKLIIDAVDELGGQDKIFS